MIEELAMFDNRYRELLRASPVEWLQREDAVIVDARESVMEALKTDVHTWKKEIRAFTLPHSIDQFRGDGDRSLVDISYAVPLSPLAEALGDEESVVPVEVGLSIGRPDGTEAISRLDTVRLAVSPGADGAYLSLYRYRLPPDTYRIAMHAAPLGMDLIGRWSERIATRDFQADAPALSDIQFLLPSSQEPAIEIEGIKVVQSPFSTIPEGEPLYVYVQVYNLVKDAAGKTSLRVECAVTAGTEANASQEVVLASKEVVGEEETVAVFEMLDVEDLGTGSFTLTVRATDRKRVQTTEGHRRFDIVSR